MPRSPSSEDGGKTDPRLLLLSPGDNVLVARGPIGNGETVLIDGDPVELSVSVSLGHKIARRDIAEGGKIVKYGMPIGSASAAIAAGAHVHVHNVKSDYTPTYSLGETAGSAEEER